MQTICEKINCEFLQRVDAEWATCDQAETDKNWIALFLPEVICPIGRHLTPRAQGRGESLRQNDVTHPEASTVSGDLPSEARRL